MKLDAYSLKARFLPALATAVVPATIFNYFYVSEEFSRFMGYMLGMKFLSTVSLSFIFIIYLSEFARTIAKGIFEARFFNDELSMPTTMFMLFKDKTYSDDYKAAFRKRIKSDFDLALASKEQEDADEQDARRKIVESMALVRKKLHKNAFLLQHNIEYGAMRNAIGGSVIGLVICAWNIYFFQVVADNDLAVHLSLFFGVIYLLLLVFSRFILRLYGKSYARTLFREYVGQK